MFGQKKRKAVTKMVYDDDLVKLLEKLGVYADIMGGRAKCMDTGTEITLENLAAVVPCPDGSGVCFVSAESDLNIQGL